MYIWSQLENASLENKSADYSAGVAGRFWWNRTTGQIKVDDGTNIRAVLRNDAKALIGNSGTASQNIRFHRGASGVLQFTLGDDATSEGSLTTSLNQISARLENYTDAGKPAAGNAGRVIWTTDLTRLQVDTGSGWSPITSATGAMWDAVIGSAGQVSAGTATHSTWASAIAAVSAGDTIQVLEGSWTETVSIDKQLNIVGNGYGSYVDGTITFTNAADRAHLSNIRCSSDITLNSGADLISVDNVWLASGKSFVDNGTGNLLQAFQET